MLRTRRKLFIKWTTEGIVKGISFRVFYDAQACVSCREYVSISLRVWADHKARWHRGILLLYNRPWTLLYKYDNVQGLFYVIRKLLISYNTKNTPWGCAFRGKEKMLRIPLKRERVASNSLFPWMNVIFKGKIMYACIQLSFLWKLYEWADIHSES